MTIEEQCNPCLCTSVRCGSVIISIFDLLLGLGYIGRLFLLNYMVENFRDFYPERVDGNTFYKIMSGEMQYGDYALISASGLFLLLGIMYFSIRWKLIACYCWLLIRFGLTFVFSIVSHIMLSTDSTLYENYGYEVLLSILLHIYFAVVVFMYSRELKEELTSTEGGFFLSSKAQNKKVGPKATRRPMPRNIHRPYDIISSSVYPITINKFLGLPGDRSSIYRTGISALGGHKNDGKASYLGEAHSSDSDSDSDEFELKKRYRQSLDRPSLNMEQSQSSVSTSSSVAMAIGPDGSMPPPNSKVSVIVHKPTQMFPGNEFVTILPKVRKPKNKIPRSEINIEKETAKKINVVQAIKSSIKPTSQRR